MCCRFHGNTLLSLGHRFSGPDLDLNERPANGFVTVIDFDTGTSRSGADHRFVRQMANMAIHIE